MLHVASASSSIGCCTASGRHAVPTPPNKQKNLKLFYSSKSFDTVYPPFLTALCTGMVFDRFSFCETARIPPPKNHGGDQRLGGGEGGHCSSYRGFLLAVHHLAFARDLHNRIRRSRNINDLDFMRGVSELSELLPRGQAHESGIAPPSSFPNVA